MPLPALLPVITAAAPAIYAGIKSMGTAALQAGLFILNFLKDIILSTYRAIQNNLYEDPVKTCVNLFSFILILDMGVLILDHYVQAEDLTFTHFVNQFAEHVDIGTVADITGGDISAPALHNPKTIAFKPLYLFLTFIVSPLEPEHFNISVAGSEISLGDAMPEWISLLNIVNLLRIFGLFIVIFRLIFGFYTDLFDLLGLSMSPRIINDVAQQLSNRNNVQTELDVQGNVKGYTLPMADQLRMDSGR